MHSTCDKSNCRHCRAWGPPPSMRLRCVPGLSPRTIRNLIILAVLLIAAAACAVASAQQPYRLIFPDGHYQDLTPTTGPVTPPPATRPARFIGVNLEALADWNRAYMTIDAMHTARKWGSATKPYDESATTDANGWPTSDCGTYIITDVPNINGTYRLSFTGKADVSGWDNVQNVAYNAATNTTTAEILVNRTTPGPQTLPLAFRNTAGGIRNVKLIRPGYTTDDAIFTREFLDALKPFGVIRFMDFTATNNSTVKTWSDRVKPTDAVWTVKGGPYEIAIALGNAAGKDIWINVPALADDDHIANVGKMVREKLKPELHCYVEYSNEVWNGQFTQFQQNLEAAKAEVAAGDKILNDTGRDTNIYHWAWRRVVKRSIQIKSLMGDDPRIRMVLCSQVGYGDETATDLANRPGGANTVIGIQLACAEKYGPPAKFFHAICCAPYSNPGSTVTGDPNLTVDTLIGKFMTTSATASAKSNAFHWLGAKYGLKSIAYEAGLDLGQSSIAIPVKIAMQYDPRMQPATERYLKQFFDAGGDGLCWFNLTFKFGQPGYWGLTEDARQLDTPKYRAVVKVAEGLK